MEQQVIKSMENYGVNIVAALERHLPLLATIASVAPMLGFLGTVQQSGLEVILTKFEHGLQALLIAKVAAQEQGSREHFAMVNAEVESMDWLELHRDGHRRARFDATGARWTQP